ncbi:hypothetical protein Vafri_1167 [Volvox africanus]|nr:hypothetical protein Vafri_1167 [Volvox africanus]
MARAVLFPLAVSESAVGPIVEPALAVGTAPAPTIHAAGLAACAATAVVHTDPAYGIVAAFGAADSLARGSTVAKDSTPATATGPAAAAGPAVGVATGRGNGTLPIVLTAVPPGPA